MDCCFLPSPFTTHRPTAASSTPAAPPPPASCRLTPPPPPAGDVTLPPAFPLGPNLAVHASTSAAAASVPTSSLHPETPAAPRGFVDGNAASFASDVFRPVAPPYGAAASLSPQALLHPATESGPFPTSKASAASGSTSGSRRLPLKRIEKAAQRQVALCKRRNRLFRKAHEISVICDATVGIIIFSSSGKVSEFCSSSTSMPEIIQRHQGSNSNANSHIMLEQTIEKWKQLSDQLNNEVCYLKQRQCYIMGEGDMNYSISDMENIESTLERSISKLRMRKMELMHQELQGLVNKKTLLMKENEILRKKMQEVNIADHEYVNMENPVNNVLTIVDSIDTTLKLGQQ